MALVKIKINGREFEVEEGMTILEVSRKYNLGIPSLCSHPDLTVQANCRICVVEIKGQKSPVFSCLTKVKEGLEIITDSELIRKLRKTNLEFIWANHHKSCDDCLYKDDCQLKKLSQEYQVGSYFSSRKSSRPRYEIGPAIVFDAEKCIDCRQCILACQKQGIGFLEVKNRGADITISPSTLKDKDCIYCGQCVNHCPVNALKTNSESLARIDEFLKDKSQIIITQIAPAVRTALGEGFNKDYGEIKVEHLVTALKSLGFNYVFDTPTGADFTSYEEAQELLERLKEEKNLPMLTSCCPSWVKYVEFYHPELIPLLTTVRSPHIILGTYLKTYWAKKQNLNPAKIKVISLMPCTAKKYEIRRPELKLSSGLWPVDEVLTTRELIIYLKEKKIDLGQMKETPLDAFASGAGVIYGVTGGVMESALRTAYYFSTHQEPPQLDFVKLRGLKEVKEAQYQINGQSLKVVVVNGLGTIEKVIKMIKEGPGKYHYIEVMACPGSCLGGGGQPLPIDETIRQKRAEVLYNLDKNSKCRLSYQNPVLLDFYQQPESNNLKRNFYTFYQKKKKVGFKEIKNVFKK